jgi:hypothetical protein
LGCVIQGTLSSSGGVERDVRRRDARVSFNMPTGKV